MYILAALSYKSRMFFLLTIIISGNILIQKYHNYKSCLNLNFTLNWIILLYILNVHTGMYS